jgi:monovalent cation:H+ antiporter-2, CPA2 family
MVLQNDSLLLAAAGADAHGGMPPLFALLAVMLIGVVLASLLLLRLQQSLLIGYFLSGVAIANSGVLGVLGGEAMEGGIAQMSEFGVMLLMFTLGLEFSLSDLKYLRRLALGGGMMQMTLCALPVFGVAMWIGGVPWQGAVILAVAVAMSSTAVSVKSFQDMDLAGSPPARLALGVAIFQDIFIIGFLLILPMLLVSGAAEGWVGQVLLLSGRGLLFVILALVLAKWVIPRLLHAVARTRNRELFTLTVVGLCIGVAFVGGLMQLSLALGAFVAGLAVSESIYKHRILADVMPMKDLFLTLFFVSVGLMIDLKVALPLWQNILLLTLGIMVIKAIIITAVARGLGLAPKVAVVGGVSLASAGEFSLLLLQKVGGAGFWTADWQQIMLASAALSMGLLPAAMRASVPLGEKLEAWGWKPRHTPPPDAATLRKRVSAMEQHAIICGYGPVGQHLNHALRDQGMQTLVIDLNADTVRRLQKSGQPVLFADAAHSETWDLARLPKAQLVAFTFPDASVTATALEMVREHSPEVSVLARARFASDRKRLKLLGADAVVHDEEQTSKAAVAAAEKLCQLHRHPGDVPEL